MKMKFLIMLIQLLNAIVDLNDTSWLGHLRTLLGYFTLAKVLQIVPFVRGDLGGVLERFHR